MSEHEAIPLGDAAELRRGARNLRFARWVAAAILLVAALLAFLAARHLQPETTSPIPASSTGIVVLDLSASISSDTFARIAGTLDRLARSDREYGLILFSDTAYMALPPRSPSTALRPFLRFFRVPRQSSPGALPQTPHSPWTDAFSAGTSISTGLKLALDVIRADRLVRPAVLLVSDLDDSAADVPRVAELAVAYQRAGIGLHVVGLDPEPEDLAFIRSILPVGGSFTQAALPGERPVSFSRQGDALLVGASLLAALALTSFLLTTGPLRWSTA